MHLLIDASNVCWKAHWVSQKTSNTYSSSYKMVEHLLSMILSYKKMYKDSTVWMVWDKKIDSQVQNPRKEENTNYKANRDPSNAIDVFQYYDLIVELLQYLNVKNFYPSHLEADDCIAWLSEKDSPNVIFSSDQDLAQLVSEDTSFYVLNKKKLITIDNFEREYKDMNPQEFLLYKCILGDKSDNIEGIRGYGKVKSQRLAKRWEESNVIDEFRQIVEKNLNIMGLKDNKMLDTLELKRYTEQYKTLREEDTKNLDAFVDRLKELNITKHYQNFYEWKDVFE